MKIISSFNDYYDGAMYELGFIPSNTPIYVRKNLHEVPDSISYKKYQTKPEEYKKRYKPDNTYRISSNVEKCLIEEIIQFQSLIYMLHQKVFEYPLILSRKERALLHRKGMVGTQYSMHILVIGNKGYPILCKQQSLFYSELTTQIQPFDSSKIFHELWTKNSFSDHIWKENYLESPFKNKSDIYIFDIPETLIKEVGVPVFSMELGGLFNGSCIRSIILKTKDKNFINEFIGKKIHFKVKNKVPNLREYGIDKHLSSQEVYQQIEACLIGVLQSSADTKPPVMIDDIHTLQKKGFDVKTSFRHPTTLKQLNK